MTSLVVRKVISGGMLRLKLVPVMPRVLNVVSLSRRFCISRRYKV